MKLFDITGNGKGMFAIRFSDKGVFLIEYDKLKEMQEAGFKRINSVVCRMKGYRLENWLIDMEDEGGGNADCNRE